MRYCLITYFDKDLETFKGVQMINSGDINAICADVKKGLLKGLPEDKCNAFVHQDLYHLGYYDDDTGIIEAIAPDKKIDCDLLLAERKKIIKKLTEDSIHG